MKQDDYNSWEEAQRRCKLSDAEVRMAKELGFQPKSLIKNIPAPSQKWKAPVSVWVRTLYEEKFGSRGKADAALGARTMQHAVFENRNPEYPWPDKPKIPQLVFDESIESQDDEDVETEWSEYPFRDRFGPPSDAEIDEENALMLRRQCKFRWAAQSIAVALSKLPEVQKVAAFGAVAQPLEMEVPRFSEFRRHRVEVLHECADLDLAVWLTDVSRLRELKNAMTRGLSMTQDTLYGGVAPHQVDVHILDAVSGDYRGRLCAFGQCPKPRKIQCLVPGCGAQPFLRQFEKYRFNRGRFEGEPRVTLFDRAVGFLVRLPRIGAAPARIEDRDGQETPY